MLQPVLILAAFAAGPVPDMPERLVYAGIFARLCDRDWAVRAKAERELEAKGFAALEHLRRALSHPEPEVRRRVLKHLPPMEHALLVKPKRWNLSIKDKQLHEALAQIQKATGNKVAGNFWGRAGAPVAKLNYEFRDATFWEIMDRLCRDCSLQVQGNWGDDTIRLSPAVGSPRHTGTDGSFRYAATTFQLHRNVDLAPAKDDPTAGRTDSLTLNMTLHAEPRLPFLGHDDPRVESAYDDTKASMVPPFALPDSGPPNPWGGRVSRRGTSNGYKQLTLNVAVPLARGSDKARVLKTLKGSVPVILLVAQKQLVVEADMMKAKDKKKELEGVEFHIHETKKMPNNQYQVRMTVSNKNNPGDY
ncbi:MAG: HEAT repeat domain-containing protein, partial [Gemmataceae bacterium]|nr:HEAT repeat domain-containing protein [Gemmataceae bacterium]